MTSPDFLSVCPSLLDTLSLIDHSDINNCKLVSRRMRDVIKSHPKHIGKEELGILFYAIDPSHKWMSRGYANRWLLLSSPRSAMEYEIHEDRVRVIAKDDVLKENFKRKGIPSTFNEPDPVKTYPYYGRPSTDYWFPSLLEGLRAVLSVIFQRYHFTNFDMVESPRFPFYADWYQEIGSKFQQFGCVARELYCCVAHGINGTFVNQLVSKKARFECQRLRPHKELNLSSVDFWRHSAFCVHVSKNSIKSLSQITEIITRWEQCDRTNVFSLEIKSSPFPNSPNYLVWSRRELSNILTNDLQYSSVEFDQRHLDDDTIKDFCIRITRKSDGQVMNVHYKRGKYRMILTLANSYSKSGLD